MFTLIRISIALALLGYVVINVRDVKNRRDNHETDIYHASPVTSSLQGIFGSLKGVASGTSDSGNSNTQSGGYSVQGNNGEYLRTPAVTYIPKNTPEMMQDFYPDQDSKSKNE